MYRYNKKTSCASSYKSLADRTWLESASELQYSAVWYIRYFGGSRRLDEMVDSDRFFDDPAWLMLPLERREAGLRRYAVMMEYERHESPGDKEAEEAAAQLNLTTGQFYRLRRRWRAKGSIFALVPFGTAGASRKPRLDRDVIEVTNALITKAIVKDGIRAPGEILRRIQQGWKLDKPIPSHMTLRKRIDGVLTDLTNESRGLALVNSSVPKQVLERVTAYGDVIAVDHIGLHAFVATEGGPVAPVATMAIDLFTSSIAGIHLSYGAPGPLQFEAVLRDVENRSARSAASKTQAIYPLLVFNAGGNVAWSKIISRLSEAKVVAHVGQSQRLVTGGTIANLIGGSIGAIGFSTRRSMNDTVFNPGRDPLISLDELKMLLEESLQTMNTKRISPQTKLLPMKFIF